ncbi:SDR family oxidoreductase [Francisella sciaenopsi]|uniref:SDR family oxidoreductase n=1 Tax=Francisella sciaenopsi TaxID=3055034 RepID=A0ABQ6PHP2_9GAMM
MNNIYSIKDKVVVITGATGYLGSQMVEDLSFSGAKVILLSRDIAKLRDLCDRLQLGYEQAFEVDVSNEKNVKDIIFEIYNKFGKIDVLVNNAYFGIAKKFAENSQSDWQLNMQGTIVSTDIMTQAVSYYMKKTGGGRIINISSMYGMVVPNPEVYSTEDMINPLGYGVGKAGIIQYTKYAAMMLAKYNINVNTVSYGPFPNLSIVKDKEFINKLANKTFLKRIGVSKEVTSAIYFLSLDESSFITGQNIVVDGGWTSW